jgi:hypothetical protein
MGGETDLFAEEMLKDTAWFEGTGMKYDNIKVGVNVI